MSHHNPGLISAYNSLTDKHLAEYFSNSRIRRHLQRAGLITRSGRIVPDKEYRYKLLQRAHQRHVRECLAQAIFHKVLEMERLHQIEIKKRLEELARRERMHKIKVERSKRCEEDIVRILSPHPPTGTRSIRKQRSGLVREPSESSGSPSSSRPNTAPGKMQRPVRLKPIHSKSTTASARRGSYRLQESCLYNDQLFNSTMDESRRCLATTEASNGTSPYSLPVINNFLTPVPPAMKRKERGVKVTPSSTIRGRRLRTATASTATDVSEDPPWLRTTVHQSRVCVNMVYFGKTLHLSHDLNDMRDEVKVFQQHCGGENLCVYKGKLLEGETFKFISRRHRGFPFSLTFFLNGLQVERLSSCCEFKHRKGSRLGGRHGHFGLSSVEGASPCYKCIIAMGLDKKPTPPPKRLRGDCPEESAMSSKHPPEMETERTGKCETSQTYDTETQVPEQTAPAEDKVRDDYEEDFEADEGPLEETPAKEEKSPTPSSDTEKQVKEKDASETEDEMDDIGSDSGSSSLSGSDREESDAEVIKDEDENQTKEDDREEAAAPRDENDERNPEETTASGAESALAKASETQDSAGENKKTSPPSGNEHKPSDKTSADQKTVEKSKYLEEQEKVESILKAQCSSEPELSDASTEEEEPSHKGPGQEDKCETPDTLVTFSEQQQTPVEEIKCEETVTSEVVQKQEEKHNDAEQEPCDNSNSTKDDKVTGAEEDESAGEDKATAEREKSEDQGEAQLTLSEENMAQDNKMADPVEEAQSADAAEENAEEREEKSTAETEIQPDKTGQRAKSKKEDDSSVSEPSEKTDEAVVPDNAEAEAEALRETMEIKAESSEEQDVLSCEEAPEAGTEKRLQADGEDRAATPQTVVNAENSSSLPQEHGDSTVQETADTSEEKGRDERGEDENKEAAEQMSGANDRMNESRQEKCEPGEETMEKVVEEHEKIKKQNSENEENEEEEKQTHINSDETEDEKTQENNKAEEEGNDESKTDESISKKESFAEASANDTNTKGEENKEEAEITLDEEDKVNQENIEEQEKTGKGEDCEHVENTKLEPESKRDNKSYEGEERNETKMPADEKDDEVEKPEEDDSEDKVTEIKNDEECEEKKDATEETTGEPEITEEPGVSAEADLDQENLELCSANNVESEDAGGTEAIKGKETTEETQNISEVENVGGDTERSSDKGEIDAENGEISVGSASKLQEDEEEILDKENTDLKTSGGGEEVRDTEELIEGDNSELKDVIVVRGDTAEKREDVDVESEISGTESKLDPTLGERKAREEMEPDKRGNKSDLSHRNRELDFMENSGLTESIIDEAAPSEDLEKSSMLIAVDVGGSANQVDEKTFESKTDKQPTTNENAAGTDLSAADGENRADTEDASNASEEGASVLFKPQAQNNKADDAQQTNAVDDEETPEALVREVNIDLVTNWINTHQTSKFFETYVEPLEDLREDISNAQGSNSDDIKSSSTELPGSESIRNRARMSGDEEEVHKTVDEKERKETFHIEALQSKLEDVHGDGRQSEIDPTEATLQAEKTEGKFPMLNEDTGDNDKECVKRMEKSEEYKGSREPLGEDEAQAGQTSQEHERHGFSKSDVQSLPGSQHSAVSGKPENVFDIRGGESTTNTGQDLNAQQATTEASLKPEGHHVEMSPLRDINESSDKTDTQSQQVTQITKFTTSLSLDGSRDEFHGEKIHRKASEGSFIGGRRDVQLIQDIKHTLSKDRLSTFSVDESLFGHTSYPLLTSARTESRH
ncbi:glutamate-rich protein 3 [Cololabis saira]|uniref:glutamate-rich protein 3 n=1 Tax=Cololabis saira TaxID=129043 RepID=UPI002AD54B7B|nr:glutamate-rich protein 3 [Cololabis saira]